jgi:hypothetical protein
LPDFILKPMRENPPIRRQINLIASFSIAEENIAPNSESMTADGTAAPAGSLDSSH